VNRKAFGASFLYWVDFKNDLISKRFSILPKNVTNHFPELFKLKTRSSGKWVGIFMGGWCQREKLSENKSPLPFTFLSLFVTGKELKPQCYIQWVYKAPLCITLRIKTWVEAYLKFIQNHFFKKKKKKSTLIYATF
jgi:hypothetical protein